MTALTGPVLMNEGKSIPPLLWFIILGVALGRRRARLPASLPVSASSPSAAQ